jgi:hypothetical protein
MRGSVFTMGQKLLLDISAALQYASSSSDDPKATDSSSAASNSACIAAIAALRHRLRNFAKELPEEAKELRAKLFRESDDIRDNVFPSLGYRLEVLLYPRSLFLSLPTPSRIVRMESRYGSR